VRVLAACACIIIAFLGVPKPLLAQMGSIHWRVIPIPDGSDAVAAYLWNSRSGAILSSKTFYYTLDGLTLQQSQVPATPIKTPIAVRNVDGRIFASVQTADGRFEAWETKDSGATWSFFSTLTVPAQDFFFLPNGLFGGVAEYGVGRTVGTTIVKLTKSYWLKAIDDENAFPIVSTDAGVTWGLGSAVYFNCGFGIHYDSITKQCFTVSETLSPFIYSSFDGGLSWEKISNVPTPDGKINDEIEGVNRTLYVQSTGPKAGFFRTTNSGVSWASIGGPGVGELEDKRFFVGGCEGELLAACHKNTVWITDDGGDGALGLRIQATAIDSAIKDPCVPQLFYVVVKHAPGTELEFTVSKNEDFIEVLSPTLLKSPLGVDTIVLRYTPTRTPNDKIARIFFQNPAGQCFASVPFNLRMEKAGLAEVPVLPDLPYCVSSKFPIVLRSKPCAKLLIDSLAIENQTFNSYSILNTIDSIKENSNDTLIVAFEPNLSAGLHLGSLHVVGRFIDRDGTVEKVDTMYSFVTNARAITSYFGFEGTGDYTLSSIPFCQSFDTVIKFYNPGCDTILITEKPTSLPSEWDILSPKNFPIAIAPLDTLPVELLFRAKEQRLLNDSLSFSFELRGEKQAANFILRGEVVGRKQLEVEPRVLYIDDINYCKTMDTVFTVVNTGCDTLDLVALGADSEWTFPKHTFPLKLAPEDTIRIPVHYAPLTIGNITKQFDFTDLTDDLVDQGCLIHTKVIGGRGGLSIPQQNFLVDFRTTCSPDTIISVIYNNASCDTVKIHMELLDSTYFRLLENVETLLLPGKSAILKVRVHTSAAGLHQTTVHIVATNHITGGLIDDYPINLIAHVTEGKGPLAAQSEVLNFGKVAMCDSKDSNVTVQNLGCNEVCITGAEFTSSLFEFVTTPQFPICLNAGEKRTFRIRALSDSSSGRSNTLALLELTTNSDEAFKAIILRRDIGYPDSVMLSVSPLKSATPGSIIQAAIKRDRAIPKGVSSVAFTLSYPSDVLEYHGVIEPNVNTTNNTVQNGVEKRTFLIKPFGDQEQLATILFKAYLSVVDTALLSLSNVQLLDASDAEVSCTLIGTSGPPQVFHLQELCTDSIMRGFMLGERMQVSVAPNPATNKVTLYVSGIANEGGDLSVRVIDMFGKVQIVQAIPHAEEPLTAYDLDASTLPSGVYQVQVGTQQQLVTKSFVIRK